MIRGVFGCAATAVLMLVSLGCEIAAAAETGDDKERGFYLGASVNRVEQDARGEEEIFVAAGRLGVVTMVQASQTQVDDTQTGWNLTLGYQINKYFAAELSYYDFGEASVVEQFVPGIFPLPAQITVRSRIEAFGPGVSLLGTLPVTSSMEIFARGGVLFIDQDVESRIGSVRSTRRSGDEIWMVGAGAQWSFASRWAARLEYQLTDDIKRVHEVLSVQAGTAKIEQLSLSVLFDF